MDMFASYLKQVLDVFDCIEHICNVFRCDIGLDYHLLKSTMVCLPVHFKVAL